MQQYYDTLKYIFENGYKKEDRTGTGTISYGFPPEQTFWMKNGFPLQWLKRTWFKGVAHERLWFVGALPKEYEKFGNTNIKYLVDHDVHIWDEWAYEKYIDARPEDYYDDTLTQEQFITKIIYDDKFAMKWGELGPVYGDQFRGWKSHKMRRSSEGIPLNSYKIDRVDQIQRAINKLRNAPDSRRMIINLWNVGELENMALPPCHTVPTQFWSRPLSLNERRWYYQHQMDNDTNKLINTDHEDLDNLNIPRRALSSFMYQRSADMGLGYPFNVASSALFLKMIAHVTNHVPERFNHKLGDAHIYTNHIDGMKEVMRRWEEEEYYELPTLKIKNKEDINEIEDFSFESFELNNYQYHDKIDLPVSV